MGDTKVKTAVFGKDLRVELKNYPLSKSGNKIDIVDSGEGYFMPEIGPTTFLDWPSFKRYLLFGPRTYKRVFFALRKGAKCIDFGKDEGMIFGPDQEQLKRAMGTTMLAQIGKEKVEVTWRDWAVLIFTFLTFLIVLTTSGVLR
jgi:hypothetical protein